MSASSIRVSIICIEWRNMAAVMGLALILSMVHPASSILIGEKHTEATFDHEADYYYNTAAVGELLVFDCGSSGTKIAGSKEKAEPTMTQACTEEGCSANYTDMLKRKEGDPIGPCFAVATAGNRIVEPLVDTAAWAGLKKILKDSCSEWLETPNAFFSQADSFTVAGVQEALYEAYYVTTEKEDAKGFISAGGASAQYGFELCKGKDDTVLRAWRDFRDWMVTTGVNEQCTTGTEKKVENFVAETSRANIDNVDGTGLNALPSAGTLPGDGDWVLGSFLGCNNSKAQFAGIDAAFKSFALEHERTVTEKAVQEVRDWFQKDLVLMKLKKFVHVWRTQCEQGKVRAKFYATAGMAKFAEKTADVSAKIDLDPNNTFHGDWAKVLARAAVIDLELVDKKANGTMKIVGGDWIGALANKTISKKVA